MGLARKINLHVICSSGLLMCVVCQCMKGGGEGPARKRKATVKHYSHCFGVPFVVWMLLYIATLNICILFLMLMDLDICNKITLPCLPASAKESLSVSPICIF